MHHYKADPALPALACRIERYAAVRCAHFAGRAIVPAHPLTITIQGHA
jgi:hypothetical protein